MTTIGERLRKLRTDKEMSQGEVAKYLGISRPAYVQYETNKTKPTQKIKKLCTLFNVTADYILGTDEQPNKIKMPSFITDEVYSNHEKELIKMYRELPDTTKSVIDTTIKASYDQLQSEKKGNRGGA